MGFAPLGSHTHGANEKGGATGPTNPMQQISQHQLSYHFVVLVRGIRSASAELGEQPRASSAR
jgi:hypothetical protein